MKGAAQEEARAGDAVPARALEPWFAAPVAALFVETNGVYCGLEGVDPWDEERDARLYAGPWPVVAHPPCARWSLMGLCRGYYDGEDDGCFESALDAVRMYGGVLEHPAHSLAWKRFGLSRPRPSGWIGSLLDDGVTCEVDQRRYGHESRKPTWLYFVGQEPPELRWGLSPRREANLGRVRGWGQEHMRSRTPIEFRDALLAMAVSVHTGFTSAASPAPPRLAERFYPARAANSQARPE